MGLLPAHALRENAANVEVSELLLEIEGIHPEDAIFVIPRLVGELVLSALIPVGARVRPVTLPLGACLTVRVSQLNELRLVDLLDVKDGIGVPLNNTKLVNGGIA